MKIFLKIILGITFVLALLAVLGRVLPPPTAPAANQIVKLPNGSKINTFTKGPSGQIKGTPIVLSHGLPGSAHDWPELVDELVAQGFQVIWYDRIGYGHSSRRAEGADFSMQANGDELDALIAAMGIENPALVGWSFGGGVVQSSKTARNPDTPFIVLLAAIGPSQIIERQSGDEMHALEWIVRMPLLGALATWANISARFAGTIPKRWVDLQRRLLLMPGSLDTYRGELNGLVPSELSPGDIQTPTLIIHGSEDPMVAYAVGTDLNQVIKDSKLVTLDGVGHMIPLTHPKEIADAIRAFSQQNEREHP